MWKYIRAAFLLRIRRVPVNLIFVAAVIALGAVREWRPIWLFGGWLEAAYLFFLASSTRFQKWVDGQQLLAEQMDPELQRQRLLSQLAPNTRKRYDALAGKCENALDIARRNGAEEFSLQTLRDGLARLSWLYLKLLLGRQFLEMQNPSSAAGLDRQIDEISAELSKPTLSDALRKSKSETLRILRRRWELLSRRAQTIDEINADLARIEAEVDLAVENAALGSAAPHSTFSVTLATATLETDLFGASQPAVESVDRMYEKGGA